jgi:putative addiction module component (TIGR02574 family)
MDFTTVLEAARSMPLDDRIRLVEAICKDIDAEQANGELSDKLRQELERRIAEADASPEDEIPWEVAKADIQLTLKAR